MARVILVDVLLPVVPVLGHDGVLQGRQVIRRGERARVIDGRLKLTDAGRIEEVRAYPHAQREVDELHVRRGAVGGRPERLKGWTQPLAGGSSGYHIGEQQDVSDSNADVVTRLLELARAQRTPSEVFTSPYDDGR